MYFLVFALSIWALGSAAPANELITSLPNLKSPMRSKQYSGYLNITAVKSLYYWYIESENDPTKDPVVLWLNGGPGCSSLEGLFVEMGPYRVYNYGADVERNKWTWNRNASIIYLDAPAGVGFSVRTDDPSKWIYTDDEVASDNLAAITLWFQKFPERQGNDFYVAGESYGGTYVPMLSALIIKNAPTFPNYKGMAIGNGCIDDVLNYNSLVGFNYNHAAVDETTYRQVMGNCCPGLGNSNCDFWNMQIVNPVSQCSNDTTNLVQANYYLGVDPYFLYYTCYLNPADAMTSNNYKTAILKNHLRKYAQNVDLFTACAMPIAQRPTREMGRLSKFHSPFPPFSSYPSPVQLFTACAIVIAQRPLETTTVACAHYNDSTVYLMRQDVRTALHIPDSVPTYQSCSDVIGNLYDQGKSHYLNQQANTRAVINAGKKVMLFNGDVDSICNNVHNQQFVASLGYKMLSPAQPWNDDSQLPPAIGMITRYQGVDFLTIRGAGHFASSEKEKPKEAYQMFTNFLFSRDYSTPITEDIPDAPTGSTSTITFFLSISMSILYVLW